MPSGSYIPFKKAMMCSGVAPMFYSALTTMRAQALYSPSRGRGIVAQDSSAARPSASIALNIVT